MSSICITNIPVRIAKMENENYLLFNTLNFKYINLDYISFNIYNYIKNHQNITLEKIYEFTEKTFPKSKLSIEDIYRFITFLKNLNFIEGQLNEKIV